MVAPAFRWGVITSPGFGVVTTDMIDLPEIQEEIQAKDIVVGGVSTSLLGVLTADRLNMKRSWTIALGPQQLMASWWPVLRIWETYAGPFSFYDHARPNLLTGNQKLMQTSTWSDASGAILSVQTNNSMIASCTP